MVSMEQEREREQIMKYSLFSLFLSHVLILSFISPFPFE